MAGADANNVNDAPDGEDSITAEITARLASAGAPDARAIKRLSRLFDQDPLPLVQRFAVERLQAHAGFDQLPRGPRHVAIARAVRDGMEEAIRWLNDLRRVGTQVNSPGENLVLGRMLRQWQGVGQPTVIFKVGRKRQAISDGRAEQARWKRAEPVDVAEARTERLLGKSALAVGAWMRAPEAAGAKSTTYDAAVQASPPVDACPDCAVGGATCPPEFAADNELRRTARTAGEVLEGLRTNPAFAGLKRNTVHQRFSRGGLHASGLLLRQFALDRDPRLLDEELVLDLRQRHAKLRTRLAEDSARAQVSTAVDAWVVDQLLARHRGDELDWDGLEDLISEHAG